MYGVLGRDFAHPVPKGERALVSLYVKIGQISPPKNGLLEHPQNHPDCKIKLYKYHQRPLRRQVDEGVLINNALEGESEITRGGKMSFSAFQPLGTFPIPTLGSALYLWLCLLYSTLDNV